MKYLTVFFVLITTLGVRAQTPSGISIGKNNQPPHESALLELNTDSKGFLLPRLTTYQRTNISNPAEGLLVYDIDLNNFYYYSGEWKEVGAATVPGIGGAWINTPLGVYTFNDVGIGDSTPVSKLSVNADLGKQGIIVSVNADSLDNSPSNYFSSIENVNTGFHSNLSLYTKSDSTSVEEPTVIGIYNYVEANFSGSLEYSEGTVVASYNKVESKNKFTVGVLGQVDYSGSDESELYISEDSLNVAGIVFGGLFVANPGNNNSALILEGSVSVAVEDHKGINVGSTAMTSSDSTLYNISLCGISNKKMSGTETFNVLFSDLKNDFPDRFTTSLYLNNFYDSIYDFNVYADGNAKSYFGGNVGIKELNPSEALHVNGNILSNGVITQSSDSRLKHSIKLLDNSLSKILSLNGVSFFWNNENKSTEKQIGLIAQEVEKAFPELVRTDTEGFRSVNYSGMVAPLIEAIKSLNNKIGALELELQNDKNEILLLKSMLGANEPKGYSTSKIGN